MCGLLQKLVLKGVNFKSANFLCLFHKLTPTNTLQHNRPTPTMTKKSTGSPRKDARDRPSGLGGGNAGQSSGEDQGTGGGPGNSLWKNYKAIQLARNPGVSTDQLHSRFKAMTAEQKVRRGIIVLHCLLMSNNSDVPQLWLDTGFISGRTIQYCQQEVNSMPEKGREGGGVDPAGSGGREERRQQAVQT